MDTITEEDDYNIFTWKTLYETKYINIKNGERISYRECGKGETIVLIHGHYTCSLTFDKLMKSLEPNFHCIAPCLRGYGYSSYNNKILSL